MKTAIGKITFNNMEVNVNKIENSQLYEFEAIGESSVPLAVELASLQYHNGAEFIDNIIRKPVILQNNIKQGDKNEEHKS